MIIQYTIIHYTIIQYKIIQYMIIQYTIIQYTIIQYMIIQYRVIISLLRPGANCILTKGEQLFIDCSNILAKGGFNIGRRQTSVYS